MPATTRKQQKFMALCYVNPGKAKGKCPSRKVARHFMHMKKGSK